ncbi:protein of unknown function [Cupriavidus taiwanensis]|uniref:Uncharacterized protein n=1 Tax=Cupriavidus taiwanensis TaxID=164546 RepID=A0A375IGY5_9BURK|nr:protein of unknown function [Cupriavidus taiwanensis]
MCAGAGRRADGTRVERPAARTAHAHQAARLQPTLRRGVHAPRSMLRMLGAGHAAERRAAAQPGSGRVAGLHVR